jgi:hypothetical protein
MIATFVILAAAAHARARPLDACHVLTKPEIATVQGESYADAKLTTHGETTTCFYQLPTFTRSVSVDVTRSGGRRFWEEHFEHEAAEEDPGEKVAPPREVKGVGDDALWIGSRAAGSLYVRKGDALLRVSAGGAGADKEKITRSKKLAQKALKRL